jgi:hypothetical protein
MSKWNRRRHYRERRALRTQSEVEVQLKADSQFLTSKRNKPRRARIIAVRQTRIDKELARMNAFNFSATVSGRFKAEASNVSATPRTEKKGPSRSEQKRQERRATRKAKTAKPEPKS